MAPIPIEASDNPLDEAFIADQLSAHSDPFLGEDQRRLCLVGRDAEGRIVAGPVGKTGWNYLEVIYVWVDASQRGAGHASRLMRAAEDEALRRGCEFARLDTFSFQALDFYLKLGYREFGRLPGYSGKYERHFLSKRLGPS